MVLLRRSGLFGAVLVAASFSFSWASSQEAASSSTPPHIAEDVSTIGTSSGGGIEANHIEDSGGRLVVVPFALAANGQRGVPRLMWSSSPLLHALSSGLTAEPGSSAGEESLAWQPTTWSAAALYARLMDRTERAMSLGEEAQETARDDSEPWAPEGIWLAPRAGEADDGYYDDDGDDQDESGPEEDVAGAKEYDAVENPAEESMETAENIIFRPLFRYKTQQAAKRRSYSSKRRSSRRKYRPRRRYYPSRKYRPYYNYNYYYPYNYYRQ